MKYIISICILSLAVGCATTSDKDKSEGSGFCKFVGALLKGAGQGLQQASQKEHTTNCQTQNFGINSTTTCLGN